MEDRTQRPLAAVGFGGRGNFLKCVQEENASALDDDELATDEEYFIPPNPKRDRITGKAITPSVETWVKREGSDIDELLEYLKGAYSSMTFWEHEFLSSVTSFLDDRGGLTARQYDTLESMAEKYS